MKTIVISNRLPMTIEIINGDIEIKESVGGLVSGISSYLNSVKSTSKKDSEYKWIGWPGSSILEKYQEAVTQKVSSKNIVPVYINDKLMDKFYNGFCNKTIWPLFHYFSEYTIYDNEMWKTYKLVNEMFCNIISKNVEQDDILWIQDYHLMLLPGMLRKLNPEAKICFFLHIPFPHYEIFRLLPPVWRKEILEGLLGADLVGFHTYEYTKYFIGCTLRILGYENNFGEIQLNDRIVKTDTFPMGIDYNLYENLNNSAEVEKEKTELKSSIGDKKIVLSIDRLDYSKGIINRLRGYELFLKDNPESKGLVTLLAVVVPSRIGVDRYYNMKKEIDETIGKINGLYGTLNWTPIIYQYKYLPINELVATYNVSDIALITPLT